MSNRIQITVDDSDSSEPGSAAIQAPSPNGQAVEHSLAIHPTIEYIGGETAIDVLHFPKESPGASVAQQMYPRPSLIARANEPALPVEVIQPQPFAKPAQSRLQPSNVLNRYTVPFPSKKNYKKKRLPHLSKLQLGFGAMAAVVFLVGLTVSLQTVKTNHQATAQVAALAKKSNNASSGDNGIVPSTTKPSAQALSQYYVSPDLARYLKIPKLNVFSRVMQVGVTSSGAVAAPSNVYDAAWYTGSAKPGQPGATLIDGHVSSWTTHGIFYNLKTLVAGDNIQVVRGDGVVINYQVVKTQIYNVNNVDMHAAISPITTGKPGLNLITCTGSALKGTSAYSQRVIVFAQQV